MRGMNVICSNPPQAPGPSSAAPAASNGKTVLEGLARGRHITTRSESSYCVSPLCLNSETYHVLVMKREKRKRLEKARFHRSGSRLIGPSVALSALMVMSNLTPQRYAVNRRFPSIPFGPHFMSTSLTAPSLMHSSTRCTLFDIKSPPRTLNPATVSGRHDHAHTTSTIQPRSFVSKECPGCEKTHPLCWSNAIAIISPPIAF